ncbi:response regulator [Aquimarina hainanensis]|uniref:histidine kinase n=1 Tax=Aquimarina hainanensis TaxID=1578017 RepID=A0ABW5NBH8_9FLAO|nr:response regulator [Aquimarina sp. TRL1]QKX06583.1 response regulator [Aquimarina sp. TRL1]
MTYVIISGGIFLVALFLLIKSRLTITSLKTKNKELQASYEEVQFKSNEQNEFIYSLIQELRTPLYGIMGLTHLIVDEHPEIGQDKKLKSLKFAGDHLLTLINNVLQVHAIDNNDITVQQTVFNLKESLQNMLNSFSYTTDNSSKLHFNYDRRITKLVKGDQTILSQILMNLICNALRFTKNGNVFFSVDLIKESPTINTIKFSIKHDGSELSKEDQNSIYDEFTNIEKAKRSYLGAGINYKIIKKLTDTINSTITIDNNPAIGSEYSFTVTYETFQKLEDYLELPKEKEEKIKVLVVDDNKLNLLVAQKILTKENLICQTLDNGFDAIELLKNEQFDIVLMDINMPNLNGIGTTKRIRKFNTKTPIIALTAVDITQLNLQITQAGINDYILKPYNKNHLLQVIHKHTIAKDRIIEDSY